MSHIRFPLFLYLVSLGWWMAVNHTAWDADFHLPPPRGQREAAGPKDAQSDPRGWLPLDLVSRELTPSPSGAHPASPWGLQGALSSAYMKAGAAGGGEGVHGDRWGVLDF